MPVDGDRALRIIAVHRVQGAVVAIHAGDGGVGPGNEGHGPLGITGGLAPHGGDLAEALGGDVDRGVAREYV
ncbi:hypothetical protein ACFFX0_12060 [Citricoccus parietis]|uniref:Uncharacterized protein n=1 Tax=Citricoccus parietis TaxID=592307 RepID=A0ABV5FYY6_9MICC